MRTLLVATALLLAPVASSATEALPLSVKDLATLADMAVVARVDSSEARWLSGRIWTHVQVTVTEPVKGAIKPKQTVTVMVPGGEVGDIGQWVDGAPTLVPDTNVLIYLEQRPIGLVVTGLGLGVFEIERDETGADWAVRAEGLGAAVRRPLSELLNTTRAVQPRPLTY